jgi:hypothetical protein
MNNYNGSTVNQTGCTYSRLGSIYSGMSAGQDVKQDMYIVPKLCPDGPGPSYPPQYDTLSHKQQYLCGGYFNVRGAYPFSDCSSCKAEYVQRPCKGVLSCNVNVQAGSRR